MCVCVVLVCVCVCVCIVRKMGMNSAETTHEHGVQTHEKNLGALRFFS